MTPEQDEHFLSIIERAAAAEERIAAAVQRLADHFAPEKEKRTGKPALLTTATYKREEAPQPPRRAATTVRGG